LVVGPHAPDDDVGEQPLVGAAGFSDGLVLGALAAQVVLGRLVAARLGDVHGVQHRVDPALTAQIEPMPLGLTIALLEETATGAAPHQRAKRASVVNRVGSPTSTSSSIAPTAAMPTSSVRVQQWRASTAGMRWSS
jgi:hypothetical protein